MQKKIIIPSLLLYIFYFSHILKAQELPNPAPNMESIAAGSYVIPMDNEKQTIQQSVRINSNLEEDFQAFNIKAYGLVYQLLEAGVVVKWVIKSGKQKNEIDFTASASKLFPTTEAAQSHDFKASAFVVDVNDNKTSILCTSGTTTAGQNEKVENIITDFGNEVAVYQLSNPETLDVRYTLNIPPKIALLTDGGFSDVGEEVFSSANVASYEISNSNFLANPECNTFVLQPHIEVNEVNPTYTATIEKFVNNGGNFLAQCISIMAFENIGFYQTTGGFQDSGADDFYNFGYNYSNSDLPIMQFDGQFSQYMWGTTAFFAFNNNSTWTPNAYGAIQLSDGTGEKHVVSGADLNGSLSGGNMYYCGGHRYDGDFLFTGPSSPAISIEFAKEIINCRRVILNAAFIPANINFACAGADVCICEGESTELGCSSNKSDLSYTWSPTTGLSCTDCLNPIANPTETTTYTITPSTGECGSASITVTVVEDGSSPSIENIEQICSEDKESFSISFEVKGTTPEDYTVSGNEGTLNNGVFTSTSFNNGDAYRFEVTNSNGCGETLEDTFDCRCSIGASISGQESICQDSSALVTLPIELTGDVSEWELVYAIDRQAQTPITATVSPYLLETGTAGTYTLVSVDGNNCIGTVQGSAIVQEIDCRAACVGTVPGAFSPNEDGINDELAVLFPDCNVQNIRFRLFNRWGKLLFETMDVDNEYWDGTFQGKPQNIGVYIWSLSYDLTAEGNTTQEVQKGVVLILR